MKFIYTEFVQNIKVMAGGENFRKGKELFDSGKVTSVRHKSFWKNEFVITSEVCGYNIRMTVSNGRIAGYGCDCDYFKGKKGMCAHVAAAAVFYCEECEETRKNVLIYTSAEGRNIISSYMSGIESREFCDETGNADKQYDLDIYFDVVRPSGGYGMLRLLSVRLRVGSGRLRRYAGADLETFLKSSGNINGNVNINVNNDYGAYNSELMSFLKSRYEERNIFWNLAGDNGDRKKSIYIYGDHVEDLFEIQSRRIRGNLYIDDVIIESVEEKVPKIELSFKRMRGRGYRVEVRKPMKAVRTFSKLYIICKDAVYVTRGADMLKLQPFLDGISSLNDPAGEQYIDFSRKDMIDFYNLVINEIEDYVEIDYNGINAEEFKPDMLTAEFYVSCNDNGDIIMDAVTSYNGELYDIFTVTEIFASMENNMPVKRNFAVEKRIKRVIRKYFGDGMRIDAGDIAGIYAFIDEGMSEFESMGTLHADESVKEYNIYKEPYFKAGLYIEDNSDDTLTGNLLKINIESLGYTRRELESIFEGYRAKRKFVKINPRGIVKPDAPEIAFLSMLNRDMNISVRDITDNKIFVPRCRILYLNEKLKNICGNYDRNEEVDKMMENIARVREMKYEIPQCMRDILREYQKTGYSWLKSLDMCGFGGILADDMGLGKTIQIIAFLLSEKAAGNTSLIVTPASLVYNWESEIGRFAKELTYTSIVGSRREREDLAREMKNYDIVITSYDLLKRDLDLYKGMRFRIHVIDEAQYIKNPATECAKTVKRINSMTRIALTGTPVENRLSELWSIFDFIMPGALYGYARFKKVYEQKIMDGDIVEIENLRNFISPFILRRIKTDVLKELPDKLEYEMYTRMEGEQDKLYLANALKLRKILEASDDSEFCANRVSILAELTKLRQICCDPSLCYIDYDEESCKLRMCMDLIDTGIEGGHKMLLFSQFASMLEIIGEKLNEKGIKYHMIVGSTKKELRVKMAEQFNEDDTPVFLISLKAGGNGLNLTAADMVIHYDPWWNYAMERQAADRTHRIGQKNIVSVFKLIAKNTVEEYILNMQKRKEKLTGDILSAQNVGIDGLTRSGLIRLLNMEEMEKV